MKQKQSIFLFRNPPVLWEIIILYRYSTCLYLCKCYLPIKPLVLAVRETIHRQTTFSVLYTITWTVLCPCFVWSRFEMHRKTSFCDSRLTLYVENYRTGKMTRLLRLAGLGARVGVAGGTLVLLHQQGVWGDSSQVIRSLDAWREGVT